MKVILCIGVIVICAYIGYSISKTYIVRKKFFFCLSSFLSQVRREINFNSKKLEELLCGCNMNSKEFSTMVLNYKKLLLLGEDINKKNLFADMLILSQQEKDCILDFFKSLGKLDVYNQVNTIDNFYNIIQDYYTTAKEESAKYSTLYIKLGIIVGAFIALIII